MADKLKDVTVFTGDLVKSTQLTTAQMAAAFEALSLCADKAAEWHEAPLQFTRHRGDGWQVILNRPEYALRTALYFRASLKALGPEFDTYIGIASGPAEQDEEHDLNNRFEEVFIQSGGALEILKSRSGFTPKLAPAKPGADAANFVLADEIAEGWTPAQANAMVHMLDPNNDLNYTELAKILNKSRQVVTKTLNAAGFQRIIVALSLLEQTDD